MSAAKDHRREVREAVRRGWVATITGSGHVRLQHPSGAVVIASASPFAAGSSAEAAACLARAERAAVVAIGTNPVRELP